MFLFNGQPVPYCSSYKYLDCNFNEHLDYNYTFEKQADAVGRSLGSVITKMIKNKGFPYSVYSRLYQSCVCSVSQYGSEVFGYEEYSSTFKLQLIAARAFLGLPKNVTSCDLVSEIDWLLPHYQTRIKMIQCFGRILGTQSNRLLYKVYKWDYGLNESMDIKTWSSEVKCILQDHGMK